MYWKSVASFTVAQIVAITFTQRKDGPPGTEHLLPKVRKGLALGADV